MARVDGREEKSPWVSIKLPPAARQNVSWMAWEPCSGEQVILKGPHLRGLPSRERLSQQKEAAVYPQTQRQRELTVPVATSGSGWRRGCRPPWERRNQTIPMENLRGVRQVPHRKASFRHLLTPENTYSRPQLDTLSPHLSPFYSTRPLLLLQPGARQLINVKKVLLTQCPMMGSSPWVPAHHHFNWCLWHTDGHAPDGSPQSSFCHKTSIPSGGKDTATGAFLKWWPIPIPFGPISERRAVRWGADWRKTPAPRWHSSACF